MEGMDSSVLRQVHVEISHVTSERFELLAEGEEHD